MLGLFCGVLAILLGLTGALLSLYPALDRLGTTVPSGVSVAEMASRVVRQYPGVEQIQRTPSGTLIVYYSTVAGASVVRALKARRPRKREAHQVASCSRSTSCRA